jgi:NodT family efflux transporter outer membrane factor (OMF) lipoprotein
LQDELTSKATDPQTLAAWWKTLDDPLLTSLIERTVAGNLDLKTAWAKVREARARLGLSQADLFPTLTANGSTTHTETRQNSPQSTGSSTQTRDLYKAGFDAGWELDIFGGVRRSIEAADANVQSSQEALRDVLVSLLAETALNYVEVRSSQSQLAVAESNLAIQQETYTLTQLRYQAGLSDDLAVQQAQANLENTRSQIPSLRSGLEAAENRLAVLVGEPPGTLEKELAENKPLPVPPPEIAVGVPAETLRQRPDVRQAERQLAAQTARIGVATAELYPKFSLSGSIGLEANSIGNLFSEYTRTLSFGPRITWKIFDAGAVRRNIEAQSALRDQNLYQYESKILSALEEVENALTAYANEQIRRQALLTATQAAIAAADLSKKKYEAGLVDFQVVLDSQRSLLSAQNQLAQSEGTVIKNLISLYKSLGGGWTSLVPDAAP